MRKLLSLVALVMASILAYTQDFSNKGKEFWLGYGNHQEMYNQNNQGMSVYITSDVNTTALVEIPGLAFSQNVTITANTITTVNIPQTAILNTEGKVNKGIHVIAQKPVVVYAHIYFQSVSGATLCLPLNTLGREYYSVNFTQVAQSNVNGNSYSYFFVVGTEDNTTVEITPSAATEGGKPANTAFTTTLNKGEIYQVLSRTDLTGSVIKSINTGAGCKKIAVYCGSGRIGIGCNGGSSGVSSSDNLFQQMYPNTTWGKKYITVPSATRPMNYYRIIRPDPAATVTLNGVVVPATSFTSGFYYEFRNTQTNVIESDKPILVAQYFTTQGCQDATNQYGDPEMIYLNPVEQTLSDVTLTSMRLVNPVNGNRHFLNVVVKNTPAALNSFKIDGLNYGTSFLPLPQDPNYAYAQIQNLNLGAHRVTCDSGFNAVVYGFASTESYGYSAGANLRDLYQYVSITNTLATINEPVACQGSPFNFAITFPYQPTQIKWDFKGLFNDTTINAPVPDSSWVINGRTVYRYRLNTKYTLATAGTYQIEVSAINPTADGCTGLQEVPFELTVLPPPSAAFTVNHNGCLSDSARFTDNTNGNGKAVTSWYWSFGDGGFSNKQNPAHLYKTADSFLVKLVGVTIAGCISDTAFKKIPVTSPPEAKFAIAPLACEKQAIAFTDQSTTIGGTIVKWTWDFGDGVKASTQNPSHIYASSGTYTVKLEVETSSGCRSVVKEQTLVVNAKPVADFTLPVVCLPKAAQFTDLSTISDGTSASLTYLWNFGDGAQSSIKNPLYYYGNAGPFDVNLKVTSNKGCSTDTTKKLTTIYAQAKADFDVTPEVCIGTVTTFTDKSDGKGSTITAWNWDFGNASTATTQNATHTYALADTFNVVLFVVTDKGCNSDTVRKNAIVHPLPTANFNMSNPTCEGETVKFTDLSLANAGTVTKWTWNFDDGNTSSLQNPEHIFSTVKTYDIKLDVESSKGCKSSVAAKGLNIHYLPSPNFGLPEACVNDAFAIFSDSSKIADGSEASFTYLWNFGDGSTSTEMNGKRKYAVPGNYDVKLTVTSKDGCQADTSISFTLNGAVRQAEFNINNPNVCSNEELVITDNSSAEFGNIVRVEIYWDYAGDPTAKTVDETPAASKQYRHKYADFGSPATKTFQVRYIAYSGDMCMKQVTKIITVKASPQVEFAALAAVCEEVAPLTLTQAREIFGFAGNGVYTGPGISGNQFSPATATDGLHTIRYTFTAANGCSTFAEQTILVNPQPSVDAGPDRTVLEGGFITINAKSTGTGVSYQWTPATYLDNDKIATPKVTPTNDISYTLVVTSGDGCAGSDFVNIKVLKAPKVPNAFTPNGDRVHDTWEIEFLDSYPDCRVEVFNRYGQLVYRSLGYGRAWDGKMNGQPLPAGTYYWIIDPKNGRKQMSGSVTIIR